MTSSPADGVKKNETLNGASLILGLRDVVVVDQSRGGSHVTDLANYFKLNVIDKGTKLTA